MSKINYNQFIGNSWLKPIKRFLHPSLKAGVIVFEIKLNNFLNLQKDNNFSIYAEEGDKKKWALTMNKDSYLKPNKSILAIISFILATLFLASCNPNEKVELTKEEKAEAHNTVLNRTPKLLDSLDKECAQNFVSNRQHFIDSLLKVRLEKIQSKVSTNSIQ